MKSYFRKFYYNKEQQKGILFLITFLIVINILFFTWKCFFTNNQVTNYSSDWNKNQVWLDSLNPDNQVNNHEIYPFNPNFISDYKGVQLGMTIQELDRLFAYRKLNKYVNSSQEFQEITGVSDSLLNAISPYFKFPDWVKNKNTTNYQSKFYEFNKKEIKINKKSINFATVDDLVAISGIGEGIAARILAEKDKFGGFASLEQMQYIWGLNDDVIKKLKERFFAENEKVKKWNVNEMNIKDLQTFPYFNFKIAKNIIVYRSMNGDFKNIEDLKQIKEFPIDKLEIIQFYIEF